MIDEENGQTRKTKGGKRYQKSKKVKRKNSWNYSSNNFNIISNIIRCWNWNGCWKNIKNKF